MTFSSKGEGTKPSYIKQMQSKLIHSSGRFWSLNPNGRPEIWTVTPNFGFWTLVAELRFWLLVADFGFWTIVAFFLFRTLVADFGI